MIASTVGERRRGVGRVGEPQAQRDRAARPAPSKLVVQRRLRAAAVGSDRRRVAVADRAVERVLDVRLAAGVAGPKTRSPFVSLSVNSGRRRRVRTGSAARAGSEPGCCGSTDAPRSSATRHTPSARLARDRRLGPRRRAPRPRVAEPRCGRMCSGAASGPRLCASIRMQMSSGVGLGVLDDDVEVAVARRRCPCRAARTRGPAPSRRWFSSTSSR